MNELHDWLERLGQGMGRLGQEYERMAGRIGDRFGDGGASDDPAASGNVAERPLMFGAQPELRLHSGAASVTLRATDGSEPRVVFREPSMYETTIEVDPATRAVNLEFKPSLGFDMLHRSPHVTCYLPNGTRVRGQVEAGKITAVGLHDVELDLRTSAGAMDVQGCNGRLRLASGAGRLDVKEFTGSLDARTDAGAIRCQDIRLEAGSHSVQTSLGAIEVSLAPDAAVRLETHTTLGSVSNPLGEGDANAEATLTLRAELGTIRVSRAVPTPTPLRHVPVADERGPGGSLPDPPADQRGDSTDLPSASPQKAAPEATDTAGATETMRILGMLERHEISAGEAAKRLAALRK